MVVVMKERATEAEIDAVIAQPDRPGHGRAPIVGRDPDRARRVGGGKSTRGLIGDPRRRPRGAADHRALQARQPHLQARGHGRRVGDVRIGGDEVIVMAGPCSAETDEQTWPAAAAVKRAGAKILRGGAFKPRSSPYSFQGLGEEGLQMLRRAARATTCRSSPR